MSFPIPRAQESQTLCIDVPPNPPLGGSIIAIAEHLLMHMNATLKVHLNVTDDQSVMSGELIEILNAIAQCEGVTVGRGPRTDYGRVSGRFESPIGLTSVADGHEIRSVIGFRPEILAAVKAKLRAVSIDDVIAFHGNIAAAGGWESSRLTPWEGVELAEAVLALNTSMTIVIVGADAQFLSGKSLPKGIELGSNLGLSAKEQMALVQDAQAFLGMSSGPSVFAMMSNVPYIIIKHYTHHTDLVKQLLGGRRRLPFAGDRQEFFVTNDTFDHALPVVVERVSEMLEGRVALVNS